jgi:DnaK suppressor protein
MDQPQLARCRGQLVELTRRVRNDAAGIEEQARGASNGTANGDTSLPLETGTEEFLQDLNAELLENERYIVSEARAAIERIDHESFGYCEICERPIAKERLDAIPYTRFCIRCADQHNSTPRMDVDEGRTRAFGRSAPSERRT